MDGDVVSSNGGDEYVLECDIMLDFSCRRYPGKVLGVSTIFIFGLRSKASCANHVTQARFIFKESESEC